MSKFIFVNLFLLRVFLSYSQSDSLSPIISSNEIGHFLISTFDSVEIVVKLDKVRYRSKEFSDYPEADISIKVENTNKETLYIRSLSTSNSRLIDVKSIELYGLGRALLFMYDFFPCYGKGCTSFQIFGINELGYFVPFTGVIDLDMGANSDSISQYKTGWFNNKGIEVPLKKGYSYYPPDNQLYLLVPDYINFCQLGIISYYPIIRSGIFMEKYYKATIFDKMKIRFGKSNFQTITSIDDAKFREPIKLYSKPDTLSSKRLLNLKVNSIVKYIEGCHNVDYWVHLRVDGFEGYILWDQLYNLGLEPCD